MNRFLGVVSKIDWLLAGSALVLVAFGLAAIYSVALSTDSGELPFFAKQLIAFAVGFGLMLVLATSNYRLFAHWTIPLYIVSFILLIGVLLFGATINGTTGWFKISLVSFQPVELTKIILVLVLAKYFSERARRQIGWREIIGSGLLALVPAGLVALQPDYGSALSLVGLWMAMLFFSGLKWKQTVVLMAVAVVSGLIAWFGIFGEAQHERFLTFVDPSRDPLGRGYNVTQAIIAVGSGQFFGRGLGFGSQSQLKFLPESQTDFIFAVIAEELGFVGVVLILSAFSLLFWRLFRLVRQAHDDFTCYLLLGVIAVFLIQAIVNVGMNLGLLPVTGIGLPFVSYGGSSMLMVLILLGLAESIAVRTSR